MYPRIFEKVKDDPTVTVYLGSNPVRLFPFGNVPAALKQGLYASWQVASGNPQNNLSSPPDSDVWLVQVDIWADTADETRNAASALITALQKTCWIQNMGDETRDFETKRYRYSFDVKIIQPR